MKLRLMSLALITALLGAFVLAPMDTAAQPDRGGTITAVGSGTSLVDESAVGNITGTISNLVVSVDRTTGNLVASGTFTPDGDDPVNFVGAILTPNEDTASCEILDLTLGPLDLNLLGLEVNLSQIDLTITAVPGPGNLLGNLLCAVAGLLDRGGPAQGLAGLLNNLLRNLLG